MLKRTMKVLIAHDGSGASDRVLDGLSHAGLPKKAAALVLTVADAWLPEGKPDIDPRTARAFPAVAAGRRQAVAALSAAKSAAAAAARKLSRRFPGWTVRSAAVGDSPAWAVIKKALEWKPGLVVVGSRGHSGLDRMLLGSVSHQVLAHCPFSVRVSRVRKRTGPPRVLVALDGSAGAEAALREAAARSWPEGTRFRVCVVVDRQFLTAAPLLPSALRWAGRDGGRQWVLRMAQDAAARLGRADAVVIEGDPKRLLVEQAEEWKADVIFLGARGLSSVRRLLLGGVSTAVAARAGCSVEVVQSKRR